MSKKGFTAFLIVIPIAITSLISIAYVTFKSQLPNTQAVLSTPTSEVSPTPSITPSPTPSPSPTQTPTPNPTPSLSPKPSPTSSSQSSNATVTSGGNYTVLTFDLASTTIVTDSANDNDCGNDCPVKPLAQYIAENGGRAGMNGTYFCPPDYASCGGKVNSFDFAVWNNRNKKWINATTLFWGGRGMMVFRPGSAQFFPCAGCVGAPADITGGIVNYPSLVSGGQVLVSDGAKGTRSGIGFGGGKLFLVVARSSSYFDLANIFKSLGAQEALNLDGGGSVALYDGGYKVGPGRNLPNAVIIK
ncbi:hypothetical protein A3B52_01700 [Candidatus Curtissbacteria bacterium RIFCSPLOWO2_01_FULL_41_28]|uniref:Phosphodiester glycosidase domain-containing protein n=1 Tax=Candidatus Curtissbacteria bacterium RIFOXYA1_FULL_41_14 TaxID=1797737 RepID=A0A1F5HC81_9BACT|nr:MAG: hypothetical protein UU53_C0008G0007 [Candidatus Curtissbacteria bacterium GW2011_GWC2_41_21]OGD92572.1 MAG: hypothetical protein A3E14_03380 [Candidatus Curtissbacteria bacterium RIFCSPHIGHO2_12_FULL_41_13]OGD96366.1 MAG: hypothetical protein A3B52_01700 [Candidatus Curtissbacteria bacterium RIFCSPLOWO2_01_FULL_41_28]OGE01635.1 MAG: hypothetical protein A2196_01990 [Candidatus Curtissbacteria bacterium RIFOXYA1_FULL_41_14]OGE07941.1 MAG: hypothetical protein A2615_02745 [Candidatus Cur